MVGLGFGVYSLFFTKKSTVSYTTEKAVKDTLINSISASGTITAGNNTSLTTKISGIVSQVYVTNGDKVVKGQKIADVVLDDYAKARQTSAWVAYLKANEDYQQALADKSSSDISMWNARQTVLDAQTALDNMNSDGTNPKTHAAYTDGEKMVITKTLDQTRLSFTVAESKFRDADSRIVDAAANSVAALRDYQQNSSSIVSPADGTISDLVLASGLMVNASSTTNTTNGSTIVNAQTIGKISNSTGQLIASVPVTEIDVPNVKANQKVTLTLDAFPDKSFTGKVLAVNTSGSVSSGVTSYPVTILMDPVTIDIYPNMAVTANIITNIKTDTLLVPSTAVQNSSTGSYVQVIKDGKPVDVTVTTGLSNDTQTEITSGLSEGDDVVTATQTGTLGQTTSGSTTSPFSGLRTNTGARNTVRIFQGGGPGGF